MMNQKRNSSYTKQSWHGSRMQRGPLEVGRIFYKFFAVNTYQYDSIRIIQTLDREF